MAGAREKNEGVFRRFAGDWEISADNSTHCKHVRNGTIGKEDDFGRKAISCVKLSPYISETLLSYLSQIKLFY